MVYYLKNKNHLSFANQIKIPVVVSVSVSMYRESEFEYKTKVALVSLLPKLTHAASQAAFVSSSILPLTDSHNSLSTYEYVIPLVPQVVEDS